MMNADRSGIFEKPGSSSVARTLDAIKRCVGQVPVTRRQDLEPGDCVIVSTKNSVYRLQALGGDLFHASGGWFDRTSSGGTVTINGCTLGGSVLCTSIVAATGLFLEFGNRVCTTRIQDVRVVRLDQNKDRVLN